MMDSPMSLQSTTHIVGHLLRGVESALRAVLKPRDPHEGSAGQGGGHGQEIRSILDNLGIPEDHLFPLPQNVEDRPGRKPGHHRQRRLATQRTGWIVKA